MVLQAGVGELPSTSQGVRLTGSAVRVPDGEERGSVRVGVARKRSVG